MSEEKVEGLHPESARNFLSVFHEMLGRGPQAQDEAMVEMRRAVAMAVAALEAQSALVRVLDLIDALPVEQERAGVVVINAHDWLRVAIAVRTALAKAEKGGA